MTAPRSDVVQLQVLGPLRVWREEEAQVVALVTQPRRLAILVYLTLARPRGLHARDTLVALLWPDADDARARHALRNALHALRQALGDDSILSAGDGLVGVDAARVRCDAVELESAVARADWPRALDAFAGEFLQGFHVSDAPEFEQWLATERRRLRELARHAAATLAAERHAANDHAGALAAARRALELEPESETEMRRVLALALPAGDRGAVLRVYEEFVGRMRRELDVAPSAETERAADALRRAVAVAERERAGESPRVRDVAVGTREAAEPERERGARSRRDGARAARSGGTPPPRRRRVGAAIAGVVLAALAGFAMQQATGGGRARPTLRDASDAEMRRQALALGARLPARWRADTVLLDRYLRAESHMDFDRLISARAELRALTAAAPRYAPGWAGLSHALSLSGFVDMPPRDASELARATALRALALDSTLVEPRYALITYEMFARWDLPLARTRLDSALARDPDDAELHNIRAAWERWNGNLDDAIALKTKALALQPTSVSYADQLAYNLYLAHRCGESAERLRRLTAEFDDAPLLYSHLYRALRCLGRDADATDAFEQALRQRGDTAGASPIARAGSPAARETARREVLQNRLDRLLQARRRGWTQANAIAETYAELADSAATLAWLDSASAEGSFYLHDVPFDPLYDFVRGDARFERFIRALPWRPSLTYADVKLALRR